MTETVFASDTARATFHRVSLIVLLLVLLPILLGVSRPKGMGDVKDVRSWS